MSKKNQKLPTQLNCGDPIFHVETRKVDGVKLVDIKAQVIVNIGYVKDDPESEELIVNYKYNLSTRNKPGRKREGDIITDPEEVIATAVELAEDELKKAKDDVKDAEKALKTAEKAVAALKQNIDLFTQAEPEEVCAELLKKGRVQVFELEDNRKDKKDKPDFEEVSDDELIGSEEDIPKGGLSVDDIKEQIDETD